MKVMLCRRFSTCRLEINALWDERHMKRYTDTMKSYALAKVMDGSS